MKRKLDAPPSEAKFQCLAGEQLLLLVLSQALNVLELQQIAELAAVCSSITRACSTYWCQLHTELLHDIFPEIADNSAAIREVFHLCTWALTLDPYNPNFSDAADLMCQPRLFNIWKHLLKEVHTPLGNANSTVEKISFNYAKRTLSWRLSNIAHKRMLRIGSDSCYYHYYPNDSNNTGFIDKTWMNAFLYVARGIALRLK